MQRLAILLWLVCSIVPGMAAEMQRCVICTVTEGSGPEQVADRIEYKGEVYYFCRTDEKAEFLKDPDAWVARFKAALKADEELGSQVPS